MRLSSVPKCAWKLATTIHLEGVSLLGMRFLTDSRETRDNLGRSGLESTEKAMLVAAGVALLGSVAAVGLIALQALADPSGTVVASMGIILVSGFFGMIGLAAFGVLWFLRNNKRS
jgi:hypothetical protein